MKPILFLILASQTSSPSQVPVTRALQGGWVGTLEYRDYSDNSRVKLGTLLRISKSKTDNRFVFRYVYDDGPKKVVQDEDHIDVDDAKGDYVIYSSDGKESDRYSIANSRNLNSLGYGSFVLLGKATENGVAVEIRETFKIQAKTLDILRESKVPGKSWLFRHEYKLNRVD